MDKSKWKDVHWKYVKDNYPNALILKSDQDFKPPKEWGKSVNISDIKKEFTNE